MEKSFGFQNKEISNESRGEETRVTSHIVTSVVLLL